MREVAGSHLIGSCDSKLPVQVIGGHGQAVCRIGGHRPLRDGLALKLGLAHQPGYTMFTNLMALFAKRPPDVRIAVGLATVLMEHVDGGEQRTIGALPPTLSTSSPRIIPCRWKTGWRASCLKVVPTCPEVVQMFSAGRTNLTSNRLSPCQKVHISS